MGNRIDRRFDMMRQKVDQEQNANKQQQDEALQRKAASQGGLGSGAFIKLGDQVSERNEVQKNNALNDVEMQREGAHLQQDEADTNRAFATSEREAGQGFASKEAQKGRDFQSSESADQRGFQKQLFDIDQNFKEKSMKQENSQFNDQMAMALKQFNLDSKVSDFNMDMADKMYNKRDMSEWFANMNGYNPRTGKYFGGMNTPGGSGNESFSNPLSSGGGGGKGPTVICTHYYNIGWIPKEIYKADQAYGKKHMSSDALENYFAWAKAFVAIMQKLPILNYIFWPVFYNWTYYMAWKMGAKIKKPIFGNLILEKISIPLSNFIGSHIRLLKAKRQMEV